MKPDEFDQYLARQPFRPVPPEWREEILREVSSAAATRGPTPAPVATTRPGLSWLREWLWPSPVAWGALATGWVAIVALNLAAAPSPTELAVARANARIAIACQSLLQHYGEAASSTESRALSPTAPPRRNRSGQSQVSPGSSTTAA